MSPSSSVLFVSVAHMLTVVFNKDKFLVFPMSVTKVAFYTCSVHFHQDVYMPLVFPNHSVTLACIHHISILASYCQSPLAFLKDFVS
jgi:hypothetical protein